MQALLLATGETQKLTPLTEQMPSPMVTVLNRPVMAYNLELLGRMGFKHILISVHALAHVIEKYFGDGRRWGVALEYVLQRDALGSAGALRWAKLLLTDPFIVMPADQIADLDISQAIDWHTSRRATATVVVQPGSGQASRLLQVQDDTRIRAVGSELPDSLSWTDTGIYVFDPVILDCIPARQPFEIHEHLLPTLLARGMHLQACPLPGYWNPLDTFQDYMEAQNVFLSRAVKEKNESERKVSYRYNSVESRQLSHGIWSGKNVRIHRDAQLVAPLSIGSNSWIGPAVELGPSVVVGSSVVIDQGATVKNSIILDDTYVGKLVDLENRLVNQGQLIDLHTSEHVHVTDPVMLGRTDLNGFMAGIKRAVDSCLALLFLVLSLPLSLGIGILLMITNGRVFTRVACSSPRFSRRHFGPTETFHLLNFNTRKADGRPFPFGAWLERWEAQRLPELLSVIKGDLALVGLKPVVTEAEKCIREEWSLQDGGAQAGFTGQWYLHGDEYSSLEDNLIADVYYLAIRSMSHDWKILRRTPAAWFSKVLGRVEKQM